MPRLPYVDLPPGTTSSDLAALFQEIAGLRGSVLHLHRALANQPSALRAFMGMSRYVRNESPLSPVLRELAVLATAYALDVDYEIFHHRRAARSAGVTDRQLATFPRWADAGADVFDRTERAVLAYADQLARTRRADDATFAELQSRLSVSEIVDLTITLGWYHLCAVIINGLGIEPEEDLHAPAGG